MEKKGHDETAFEDIVQLPINPEKLSTSFPVSSHQANDQVNL